MVPSNLSNKVLHGKNFEKIFESNSEEEVWRQADDFRRKMIDRGASVDGVPSSKPDPKDPKKTLYRVRVFGRIPVGR